MKKLFMLSAVALLLGATGYVMAADDGVDVKVTGQIVPPACVPAVNGGAVFDYGSIKAGSLKLDDFTVLNEKYLSLSVVCDSPLKIALKTTDARKDSAFPWPEGVKLFTVNRTGLALSGLGMNNGASIGGYALASTRVTVNGAQATRISSGDNGKTWAVGGAGWYLDDGWLQSFSDSPEQRTPASVKTLNMNFGAQVVLNKGSELDLENIVNLDGLSTIQVIYL